MKWISYAIAASLALVVIPMVRFALPSDAGDPGASQILYPDDLRFSRVGAYRIYYQQYEDTFTYDGDEFYLDLRYVQMGGGYYQVRASIYELEGQDTAVDEGDCYLFDSRGYPDLERGGVLVTEEGSVLVAVSNDYHGQPESYLVLMTELDDLSSLSSDAVRLDRHIEAESLQIELVEASNMSLVRIEDGGRMRTFSIGPPQRLFEVTDRTGPTDMAIDIGAIDDRPFLFYQASPESFMLSYSMANWSMEEHEVALYPEGITIDNHLQCIVVGEEVHMFAFRDSSYPDGYSGMDHFRLDMSGNVLARDIGILKEAQYYPPNPWVLFEGDLFWLGGDLVMYRVDEGLTGVWEYDVSGEMIDDHYDIDPWTYRIGTTIDDDGLHIHIFDEDGYGRASFSSYHSGLLPLFGTLLIDGETVIQGLEWGGYLAFDVPEGGHLTFRGMDLAMNENSYSSVIRIAEGAKLTIDDCTMSGDMLRTDSEGTVVLIDSDVDMRCNGDGTIVVVGDGNRFLSDDWTQDVYRLILSGCTLNSSGRYDMASVTYALIDSDLRRTEHLIFENCTLEGLDRSLDDLGPDRIELSGCRVNGTDTFFRGSGDLILTGSTFTECDLGKPFSSYRRAVRASSCEFFSCSSTTGLFGNGWLEMRDIGFTDCADCVGWDYSDPGPVLIEGCRFTNCSRAITVPPESDARINGTTFTDCNGSLVLDLSLEDPMLFTITSCRFEGPGMQVVFEDDPYEDTDLLSDRWDRQVEDRKDRFVDIRFCSWDASSPEEVASRVQFGTLFLPFYGPDGSLVTTDDMDLDGMDDGWEEGNGLDPGWYFDRYLDPDLDGYLNHEEWSERTDPQNGGDHPGSTQTDASAIFALAVPAFLVALLVFLAFPLKRILYRTDPVPRIKVRDDLKVEDRSKAVSHEGPTAVVGTKEGSR